VTGTGNKLERNIAKRNTGRGLVVDGTGALVERNQAASNGADGLAITGGGHLVNRNAAKLNLGDGFQVDGSGGNSFDRNRTDRNGGFGILDAAGAASAYTRNVCENDVLGDSNPPGLCL
jgi:hypothetical protein